MLLLKPGYNIRTNPVRQRTLIETKDTKRPNNIRIRNLFRFRNNWIRNAGRQFDTSNLGFLWFRRYSQTFGTDRPKRRIRQDRRIDRLSSRRKSPDPYRTCKNKTPHPKEHIPDRFVLHTRNHKKWGRASIRHHTPCNIRPDIPYNRTHIGNFRTHRLLSARTSCHCLDTFRFHSFDNRNNHNQSG